MYLKQLAVSVSENTWSETKAKVIKKMRSILLLICSGIVFLSIVLTFVQFFTNKFSDLCKSKSSKKFGFSGVFTATIAPRNDLISIYGNDRFLASLYRLHIFILLWSNMNSPDKKRPIFPTYFWKPPFSAPISKTISGSPIIRGPE